MQTFDHWPQKEGECPILRNVDAEETLGQFLCSMLCFPCDSSRKIGRAWPVALYIAVLEIVRQSLTTKPLFVVAVFPRSTTHLHIFCQKKKVICDPSGYIYTDLDLNFHSLKQIGKIWFSEKFITVPCYSGLWHNSSQWCDMNSDGHPRKLCSLVEPIMICWPFIT